MAVKIFQTKQDGNTMDMELVMKAIEKISNGKRVKYVADRGKNSCAKCLRYDGKEFDMDAINLPQLPMHPNCRCKFVEISNPEKNVSKDVEQYRIALTLKESHHLEEAKAKSLAAQIIKARTENEKLREQKLFLIFNGRYLMSSDGKLLLDAVSGRAISHETKLNASITGLVETNQKTKFDYSHNRQAVENEGGLPQGLYSISCVESGFILNGNLKKHIRNWTSWGFYHWQLIPDKNTDTRGRRRSSFTIHGGLFPGSAGCIDLTSHDAELKKYLHSLDTMTIYVYAQYDQDEFTLEEKKIKIYPIMPYFH